jgi:hypothetical protein
LCTYNKSVGEGESQRVGSGKVRRCKAYDSFVLICVQIQTGTVVYMAKFAGGRGTEA